MGACYACSSYAFRMQVYTGKAADAQAETGQGKRVILDLCHLRAVDGCQSRLGAGEALQSSADRPLLLLCNKSPLQQSPQAPVQLQVLKAMELPHAEDASCARAAKEEGKVWSTYLQGAHFLLLYVMCLNYCDP